MAERRMFALTIIDSDVFLELPLTAQNLYFHLAMRADDDGLLNNPKKIQRIIGSSEDDLKTLIAKKFILVFESGVVAVTHWKIHNYIRGDRYKSSLYHDEKAQLSETNNKTYVLNGRSLPKNPGSQTDNHLVYHLDTQDRLGQERIGEVRKGQDKNHQTPACEEVVEVSGPVLPATPCKNKITNRGGDCDGGDVAEKSPYEIFQECFGTLNSVNSQDIAHWIEDLGEEMVIFAMQRAALDNKPYSYAKGMLRNWAQRNLKSVADVAADDKKRQQTRTQRAKPAPRRKESLPTWVTHPPKEKPLSPERQAELDARLAKFYQKA